jgi:hypothetical protein
MSCPVCRFMLRHGELENLAQGFNPGLFPQYVSGNKSSLDGLNEWANSFSPSGALPFRHSQDFFRVNKSLFSTKAEKRLRIVAYGAGQNGSGATYDSSPAICRCSAPSARLPISKLQSPFGAIKHPKLALT